MSAHNRRSMKKLNEKQLLETMAGKKIKTTDPLQAQLARQVKLKVTAAGFFQAIVSRQQVKGEAHE